MNKRLVVSVFIVGFTAMASQVVLVREFLKAFCGNELSIGLVLAGWLITGAVGSALFGRLAARRVSSSPAVFIALQVALAMLLPVEVLAIRSVRIILGLAPGEIVPVAAMAMSSLIILLPQCVVLGALFVLGCRLYNNRDSAAKGIGMVYTLEAAGASAGGMIASIFLMRFMPPTDITALLGGMNALSAMILARPRESRPQRALFFAALILCVLFAAAGPLKGWQRLEGLGLRWLWRGQELVASRDSIYGNVAVTKRVSQVSFFDNGIRLFTIPDTRSAEEAANFPLLEHPAPRRVLMIGGGPAVLSDALRHPVDRIDYIEIDPLVIRMAKRYISDGGATAFSDLRVSIANADSRFFVKNAEPGYDLIVINAGDPATAQLNRLYTLEFFEEAKRILSPGGLLSFSVTSSEDFINNQLACFLGSLNATAKAVFPDVKVIPGNIAFFLASDDEAASTLDWRVLMKRAGERGLALKYVREYYLQDRLSQERISFLNRYIETAGEINRDMRPVSYYKYLAYWTKKFRLRLQDISLSLAFLIVMAGMLILRSGSLFGRIASLGLFVAGFTSISSQIIVLFGFQVICGYLFYRLGILLTAFMIGMAAGGWIAARAVEKTVSAKTALVAVQAALALYIALLPLILMRISGFSVQLVGSAVFALLAVTSGFLGGLQFPFVNKVLSDKAASQQAAAVGGRTYAIDLAGSAIGSIATAVFLIPVAGIPATCTAIALVNLTIAVMLTLGRPA